MARRGGDRRGQIATEHWERALPALASLMFPEVQRAMAT